VDEFVTPINECWLIDEVANHLRSGLLDLYEVPRPLADFFTPRVNWLDAIRAAAREVPNAEAPAVDLTVDWSGDLQTLIGLHMCGELRTTVLQNFVDAVLGPNIDCWQPTGILGAAGIAHDQP